VRRINAATKIWAAGVEGSPLGRIVADATAADVDRAGRVQVNPNCSVPGHPEIFVIGDLMSLDQLPGLAQVAIQSGRHAAQTIIRRLHGDTTEKPFRYRDKGTMATVSRYQAIVNVGRINISGFAGWVMWLAVHLMAISGFKHRIAVLANWTLAFLTPGRPQRAITTQQVFARQTTEHQTTLITNGATEFHPTNTPTTQTTTTRQAGEMSGPRHGLQC
jgi:NADH dehydrogenase